MIIKSVLSALTYVFESVPVRLYPSVAVLTCFESVPVRLYPSVESVCARLWRSQRQPSGTDIRKIISLSGFNLTFTAHQDIYIWETHTHTRVPANI
jgi:hypothetical protein